MLREVCETDPGHATAVGVGVGASHGVSDVSLTQRIRTQALRHVR